MPRNCHECGISGYSAKTDSLYCHARKKPVNGPRSLKWARTCQDFITVQDFDREAEQAMRERAEVLQK